MQLIGSLSPSTLSALLYLHRPFLELRICFSAI